MPINNEEKKNPKSNIPRDAHYSENKNIFENDKANMNMVDAKVKLKYTDE
ncbi:hypothetical protein PIROE2DRAFT_15699 [Piromyces sp. E2]|nr:hypothetical protein PIROE2DRAFT_15699 [Piromyces sp. E2]|eukprot:OUM58914.1 hypothetical protein PIROE2DRAFT_15699 [Piromyces sp. E2]